MHLKVGETVLRVEAEQTTADFLRHAHDPAGADAVVCWRETAQLPLPVLELRPLFPGVPEARLTSIVLDAKDPPLVALHAAIRKVFEEFGCWGDAWGQSKGQRQTEKFHPPRLTKGMASVQYSGNGSNEKIRLRFAVPVCEQMGIDRPTLVALRDRLGPITGAVNGSNQQEEFVDLYPPALAEVAALEAWLDGVLRAFQLTRKA
jgi:hypothetical protein